MDALRGWREEGCSQRESFLKFVVDEPIEIGMGEQFEKKKRPSGFDDCKRYLVMGQAPSLHFCNMACCPIEEHSNEGDDNNRQDDDGDHAEIHIEGQKGCEQMLETSAK